MDDCEFRYASPSDAKRCFDVETLAYDEDEAATLEKISKRIAEYPQGFLILEVGKEIVGFINSGCACEVEMSDEDFKELIGHDPAAPNVVIMSVVVDPAYQGRGLSTKLMSEFVRRMTESKKESIHLMCKEHHVSLYEKFGYRYTQPSTSAHGGVQWHEMMMKLPKT
ncbi:ribosomal protein S18 acetylase RimI-like enzyme [Litoreibacter meonggei]|uniref:Ribosomal protein S18 acetylase RimI-like enzyme n=1 Tax=Litoreibacter meonggei TaxID=1049199 RepID=A0A497VCG4_9RHOB|nr:GNAT family N-acetyltransferase [Litoreibacter meonggei]RLJ41160.1 ribosomal protein S18 acetylase RimI-like enzyme [Litoreibacter meonggei]